MPWRPGSAAHDSLAGPGDGPDSTEAGPHLGFAKSLYRGSTSGQRSRERDQNDSADEGHHNTADQSDTAARKEQAEHETADESADDPKHDIADNAVPATFHELTGKPARDKTDYQPGNQATRFQIHVVPPFLPCAEVIRPA